MCIKLILFLFSIYISQIKQLINLNKSFDIFKIFSKRNIDMFLIFLVKKIFDIFFKRNVELFQFELRNDVFDNILKLLT